jgi:predicted esterase
MRIHVERRGVPDKNGYPVYIFMHGGGQAIINELQYAHGKKYYLDSVENGIYVAVRGVRESYNTHFNPESYPLYDRLIQNLIIYKNADPNRIYLTGYSAGGDGVYGITPYMADRFAAVSMSAGHHNQLSAINYMNTPIILQCGDDDTAYDRHLETARYGEKLKALQGEYPGNYIYECNMHVKRKHAIKDNDPFRATQVVWEDSAAWLKGESKPVCKNTNAIDYVSQFTRNPLPKNIAWNLENRAPLRLTDAFYWLEAPAAMNKGIIHATWEGNTFTVNTQGVSGAFNILLNWDMADLSQPITLVINGETRQVTATPSREIIEETTNDRGDVNYQFSAKIPVAVSL